MFLSFLRCGACPRERGEQESKIPDQVRDGRSKKWFFLPLIVTAFFIGLSSPARAEFQIPEKPDGYVTDRAGLLSAAARNHLESQLHEFELQTSNQVLVATFPSLDGGSLEDLSIRLAQKWRVGQKGRDNGVIFLIFKEERRMRIEVGYGLEGVLTDAVSSQIIRQVVVPQFAAKNYEQGILDGVNTLLAVTKGEYQPLPQHRENDGAAFSVFLGLIGIIIILDLIRYSFYFQSHRSYPARYGFWEWFFLFAIFWIILRAILTSRGGGRWSSGGRGGYSGGGFSGGGGSFGGGGASGRW